MIGKTADEIAAQHGEAKRALLKKLLVCRGSFTIDAAKAITGLSASDLMPVLNALELWSRDFPKVDLTR